MLDSIDVLKPVGLRNRALIGLMVYSFARGCTALSIKVEDVYTQTAVFGCACMEKGGEQHDVRP